MKRKLNVHSIGKCLLTLLLSLVFVVGVLPTTTWAVDWSAWDAVAMGFENCRAAGLDTHDWENHYTTSHWGAIAGHNCTNYCAYMLGKSSDNPRINGDAFNWAGNAKNAGYTVNKEPAVGAVAQWDKTTKYDGVAINHVAYVEEVHDDYILVSEDGGNQEGLKFGYRKIWKGTTTWPVNFIHPKTSSSGSSSSSGSPTTPTTDISRDIVLVLDTSGSMSGTSLTYTKAAATKFVEQILGASKSTNIAIVTYAGSANTLIGLTNDKAALTKAIDGISADGMTNIYTAMQAADTILQSSKANKKAIVIMSDGEANEGTTASKQTVTTEDGEVTFDSYDSALYTLANDYKDNKGYTIYSLGFGLSNDSNAYKLLKYMATYSNGARKFWSVTKDNLADIVFTYEDIANTATAKIIIAIDCPVTAAISRGSETLDKDNTAASFGNVAVTSVTDGYKYVFTLDDGADYDIKIRGSADGAMNFKITYVYGDTEQYHGFQGVPVTANTLITTSKTDRTVNDFKLYIDNDNDGVADADWKAGANQIVYDPDDGLNPTKPDAGNVPDGFGGSDKINRAPSMPAETEMTNEVTEAPAETTATITSAKTGDMGIVVYAALSLMSMSGSAWLVSKKHRE